MPDAVIGLMSGTSLDGVDAVLLSFDEKGHWHHEAYYASVYPEALREQLRALPTLQDALWQAQVLSVSLAELYADTVLGLREQCSLPCSAIACHGQTVLHQPSLGFSYQLGHMPTLAVRTGLPVIFDFRNHDVALGGEGAPLTPLFHRELCRSHLPAAVLNLGGICNITCLGSTSMQSGDLGPCNLLLDAWAHRHIGHSFDEGGEWAASGVPIPWLLERFLAHPFGDRPFPKSTGRETFSLEWLMSVLAGREDRPQDVQRTLVEWIVCLVVQVQQTRPFSTVFLCGGGSRNRFLCARLAEQLAPVRVEHTTALGMDPQQVEAAAFAWLGYHYLKQQALPFSECTGASRPHIAGCYCPAP